MIYDTKHIVLTGGEPILYPLDQLINLFHAHNYYIHLETAATAQWINNIDWICVSPKNHSYINDEWLKKANELKVIISDLEDLVLLKNVLNQCQMSVIYFYNQNGLNQKKYYQK